ncbi:MAG TPA: MarR family transcriptional regulator [Anaerolineales bacterium]|nr:MarR family transcriptional regulator [Anaerolineales bacterium]
MASIKQSDYEALAALRYALRQFLHFSEKAAQSVGLTPQQHQALLAIKGFPGGGPITISELAERLQIRHHSAVGLVDRLAAHDFVRRESSSEDRRQVYVTLSSKGSEILESLSKTHREELRRIGPHLRELLDSFSENVE